MPGTALPDNDDTPPTARPLVILLHELGHMVAYRAFGHPSVRMIFVPLLGGIAIGGRPYNSHFEVATCALMGAGFSALLVPILVAAHQSVQGIPHPAAMDGPTLVFLVILGAFNLLNLLPTYRFDGGQVLPESLAASPKTIVFIGPPGSAMRSLGDKISSTIVAQHAHRFGEPRERPVEVSLSVFPLPVPLFLQHLKVGRIGEDEIDAVSGERAHRGDAITWQDTAQRQIECARGFWRFYNAFCPRFHLFYHTHRPCPASYAVNLSTGMSL